MSPLVPVFHSPSVSKLPDADWKPFTTLRAYIIANRKSKKILKNICLVPTLVGKNLLDHGFE